MTPSLWRRLGVSMLLCAALVGARAQPAAPSAQGPPASTQPSFTVSAELVVIDMVAVDAQSRFIADLTPDDIDLREDGRRQPVQLLQLIGGASETRPVAAPAISLSQPGASAAAQAGAAPHRHRAASSSSSTRSACRWMPCRASERP